MNSLNRVLSKITIEHLWIITVMVAIFAFVNTHPIRPHDFWWHMAIGREILTTGKIPSVDTYSYTMPGEPYPSYTMFWMMDVVLYSVYLAGGPIAIILVQSFFITSAYFLVAWSGWLLSGSWRSATFGTLFAAALGFGNWNVRPQAVTYLYGALLLWAVSQFRSSQKRGWLLLSPIVMVLWVNSHGSFPIGLAILGCWLVEEVWKFLRQLRSGEVKSAFSLAYPVGVLFSSSAACLLNPRGFGIISYLNMMAGNTVVQNYILEWMPPNFNSLEGILFYAGFIAFAILTAVSPKRPDIFQMLTFILFGVLGLKYIRGIIWFGLVMAPAVSAHLTALFRQAGWQEKPPVPNPQLRRLNSIFLLFLSCLAFFSLPWFKHLFPFTPEKAGLISSETPIQATQYILDHQLPGHVFHDMAFGSYLIWAAQPQYKVFVDSRVELYPMQIWDDYWRITTADCNWEQLSYQYGIHTLMLEPKKQIRLIEAARASPNWELVYQDQQSVLFVRK